MDTIVNDVCCLLIVIFFFFKQKTAYEMRISDWSSDVCSSDLKGAQLRPRALDRKTADQALQGPMLVPVTCICISIWPPVGAAVLVVIVMSVFFGSIVPAMARSTFWPLAVQVPATSILPPPIAFFVQVQASP